MKTKSIRIGIEDGKRVEQVSRELAAELQRKVTVSEVLNELTGWLGDAKKRIKEKAGIIS